MIHVAPIAGFAEHQQADAGRYLALLGRVEALCRQVDSARQTANDSLGRLNALPQPEVGDSSMLVALLDIHRRDREALFEAMRQLESAREALRAAASTIAPSSVAPLHEDMQQLNRR
ncbi:hypothetical protein [Aminobacter sp. AP02]|uniref:hypothetical protein n=1 Tax=Aminobacter sp. AP02 TaxID=2135737 RepID=UPI000D6AD9C9|nr:hypothetical protein [Aminobacter sp. AP02]PWK70795.1 hypothetical protein C8K44_107275 [Aminobacter sp. AP02]